MEALGTIQIIVFYIKSDFPISKMSKIKIRDGFFFFGVLPIFVILVMQI
jgi:hypothetical protein